MAAVGQNLYFCRKERVPVTNVSCSRCHASNGGVLGENVELLYDWGIVMLIRISHTPLCPYLILRVKLPAILQAHVPPEWVYGVLVKALGNKGEISEVGCHETRKDELEKLFRERFKLLEVNRPSHKTGAHEHGRL